MPEDMVKIEKESGSDEAPMISSDGYYPYGTSLNFEDDLIEQLSIGSLAVGDFVKVSGFAKVERISERSDEDGSEKTLSIQFTSIKVSRENSDHAKTLYGE